MPRVQPRDHESSAQRRIRALACWRSAPDAIVALAGGITNRNYRVDVGARRYVVRLGGDIPVNHVMRFNEHAASRAAADLGISPAVRYTEDDVLVLDYVPSETFTPARVRARLPEVLALMRRAHRGMTQRLRGPALCYWLFHVIRDNLETLREHGVHARLDSLQGQADELEAAVGPVAIGYCHNDWLAANILDDGRRLWLIDWDYGGFNAPLADLASLASNNQLAAQQEQWLLENYDGAPPTERRWRSYLALKAAALLKESTWSRVSACVSTIAFDYAAYSRMNLERYRKAWSEFKGL